VPLSSTFPALGIQEDPGRAAETRLPGRRIHHPPGPQGPEDSPGAETAHDTTWLQFLHAQASTMLATDIFHVDCAVSLQRLFCLFVMEAGSRELRRPRPDHPAADVSQERIQRRPVLGGLINGYERAAEKPKSGPLAEFWNPTGQLAAELAFLAAPALRAN
jgi:hypothetical protein